MERNLFIIMNTFKTLWDEFYEKFSPDEKKMFLKTQLQSMTLIIQKDLRKRREALRKLRENDS